MADVVCDWRGVTKLLKYTGKATNPSVSGE
jgi:hypothetical protein